MAKRIQGIVKYIDLEGGFWGIESDDNYLALNFPEQLKKNGASISCVVETDIDVMTMYNWGTVCKIISFSTLH